MIGEEIGQLRQAGRSDAPIAEMIVAASGKAVAAEGLVRFHAEMRIGTGADPSDNLLIWLGNMTPAQKENTSKAITDLRTITIIAPEPHDSRSVSDVMRDSGIQNGFIDFVAGTTTGFSAEGLAALDALAKLYRPEGSQRSRQASNATLAQVIAASIAQTWKDRAGETPEEADFASLNTAIEDWFAALSKTQLHAVPCILVGYDAPPFTIGPVRFYHMRDFPSDQFGVSKEQFWPAPTLEVPEPKIGGFQFEQLINMASERRAAWMAVVEISGRAEQESAASADSAVDIALAALQIAAPGLQLRNVARATARVPALWRADVWTRGDSVCNATSNNSPVYGIDPDVFVGVIANKVGQSLTVMGHRLEDYLGATSTVPLLDEAWCNAAYWFHEALAETLDTVAVVKLETAIEVLFRAESMSGSKSRIMGSFDAIFGLAATDQFPESGLTVEQFILNITTARSRVVHGTWPTIHTDLPGYKKQQPVRRTDLEMVASGLLVQVAHHIEAYVKAGETDDDTDALLRWIKAQRQQQAAPTSAQTSAAPPSAGG